MTELESYKAELSKVNSDISKASESDLPVLLDRKQQLIGKISELTFKQEVDKYAGSNRDNQVRIVSLPRTT